jgi:hypothetical protein
LANQVRIDVTLVCEVVRDGTLNLFKPKKLEVLADCLGRFAAAERMDDRIQRDTCVGNVVVAVPVIYRPS